MIGWISKRRVTVCTMLNNSLRKAGTMLNNSPRKAGRLPTDLFHPQYSLSPNDPLQRPLNVNYGADFPCCISLGLASSWRKDYQLPLFHPRRSQHCGQRSHRMPRSARNLYSSEWLHIRSGSWEHHEESTTSSNGRWRVRASKKFSATCKCIRVPLILWFSFIQSRWSLILMISHRPVYLEMIFYNLYTFPSHYSSYFQPWNRQKYLLQFNRLLWRIFGEYNSGQHQWQAKIVRYTKFVHIGLSSTLRADLYLFLAHSS